MNGPRPPRRSRRLLWAIALPLSLAMAALSVWIIGSPPPRKIALATGDPRGGFAELGREYKDRLERMGLHVQVVETHGSIENLQRLLRGEVDVAFVQTGVVQDVAGADTLCGLAAICSHPLWIFHSASLTVNSLQDLAGRRIALGPSDSGTAALARLLLHEYGITEANATFLNLSMGEVPRALTEGKIDCGFLVCACDVSVIDQELLADPRIALFNLGVHRTALSHRYRYLRPVTLPRGVLDFKHDLPQRDTPLLAPRIVLVVREDLHPRVVEQVLLVAKSVHGPGNRLDAPGQFPSIDAIDLPPHLAAEKFLKSGESLVARLLPYWGVRLIWQVQLLLLPALALLLPFWRTLPLLYTFRINGILKRHYARLREVEGRLDRCDDPGELRCLLESLDGLRAELEGLSRKLPAHLQRDVYHWRLHVALVRTEGRERMRRLEQRLVTEDAG